MRSPVNRLPPQAIDTASMWLSVVLARPLLLMVAPIAFRT